MKGLLFKNVEGGWEIRSLIYLWGILKTRSFPLNVHPVHSQFHFQTADRKWSQNWEMEQQKLLEAVNVPHMSSALTEKDQHPAQQDSVQTPEVLQMPTAHLWPSIVYSITTTTLPPPTSHHHPTTTITTTITYNHPTTTTITTTTSLPESTRKEKSIIGIWRAAGSLPSSMLHREFTKTISPSKIPIPHLNNEKISKFSVNMFSKWYTEEMFIICTDKELL